MKTRTILLILFLYNISTAISSQTYLAGHVYDNETKRPLVNANISLFNIQKGSSTNNHGLYSIKQIPYGEYTFNVDFIGYQALTQKVVINSDTTRIDFYLKPEVIKLEQVTISSTKYEKQVKDSSIPLSIVRVYDIKREPGKTISEIASYEPGISLTRDGIWGTDVSIRGLSKANIITLVDGNRIDTATNLAAGLSMIDTYDIEQVEIIKGAASSLYGTGGTGGVVNIITKDAWYAEKLYLHSQIQNGYSTVNKNALSRIQFYMGNSWWHAKVSGAFRKAENIKTPEGILPNSQFQDQNFSVRNSFLITKKQQISVNYQRFFAQDVGIPGGSTLFPSNAEVRYPEEKREMGDVKYQFSNINNWFKKFEFKIFKQDILRYVENIPHIVNITSVEGQPTKKINVQKISPQATHEITGFHTQSDFKFKDRYVVLFGIDGWQKEYSGTRSKDLKIEVINPATSQVMKTINKTIVDYPLPPSTFKTIGFFIKNDMDLFSKRLIVSTGGRYDFIHIENENVKNPAYEITDGIKSVPAQTEYWPTVSEKNKSWSGNVGLVWHTPKNFDVTMTLGRSFRSPSLEERFQYIDLGYLVRLGNYQLKPEKGYFSDFGFRTWTDKISLICNVFYNRLTDLVSEEETTFEGGPALQMINIGRAELYGFDMQIQYKVSPHIHASLASAYVYGKDLNNNTPLSSIAPLNGKFILSFNDIKYLSLDLCATFFNSQDRTASWETKTGGYTYYDIYIKTIPFHFADLGHDFTLGFENITNKSYKNHLSSNRGFINVEPGRNLSFTWNINF